MFISQEHYGDVKLKVLKTCLRMFGLLVLDSIVVIKPLPLMMDRFSDL